MVQEAIQGASGLFQTGVILAEFATIGGTVLYATRAFSLILNAQMVKGKARKRAKFWFSQLLGPLMGLLFYKMEVMPLPGSPMWSAIGATVLGYVGTLVATYHHLKMKRAKE